MAATERIVIDAHPSIKKKLIKLSRAIDKPMKVLISEYIEEDFKKRGLKLDDEK